MPNFASAKKLKIQMIFKEWKPQIIELSPTQKLKRGVYDKYKHIIAEIYKNGKK
jgi:hypothetical protein